MNRYNKNLDITFFSTYVSIKLQKMSQGDVLDILDCYKNELLSPLPQN